MIKWTVSLFCLVALSHEQIGLSQERGAMTVPSLFREEVSFEQVITEKDLRDQVPELGKLSAEIFKSLLDFPGATSSKDVSFALDYAFLKKASPGEVSLVGSFVQQLKNFSTQRLAWSQQSFFSKREESLLTLSAKGVSDIGSFHSSDGGLNWSSVWFTPELAKGETVQKWEPHLFKDGSMMAFLEVKNTKGSSRLLCYTSSDFGRHWSSAAVLAQGAVSGVSYVFTENGAVVGFLDGYQTYACLSSQDHGATWTSPIKNKLPAYSYDLRLVSGGYNGRIVLCSKSIYGVSDDLGRSWSFEEQEPRSGYRTNTEPYARNLPNGDLILVNEWRENATVLEFLRVPHDAHAIEVMGYLPIEHSTYGYSFDVSEQGDVLVVEREYGNPDTVILTRASLANLESPKEMQLSTADWIKDIECFSLPRGNRLVVWEERVWSEEGADDQDARKLCLSLVSKENEPILTYKALLKEGQKITDRQCAHQGKDLITFSCNVEGRRILFVSKDGGKTWDENQVSFGSGVPIVIGQSIEAGDKITFHGLRLVGDPSAASGVSVEGWVNYSTDLGQTWQLQTRL